MSWSSCRRPRLSSLQTTVKAMQRVDELVRQRPDVEATSFAAGFNMLAGIASSNSGIIFVKLVDYTSAARPLLRSLPP